MGKSLQIYPLIIPAIRGAKNLRQVHDRLKSLFSEFVKRHGVVQIGYVAGVISSDGDHKMQENIEKLMSYTDKLRDMHEFPLFSPTDIFSKEVYRGLQEMYLSNQERENQFIGFSREVLRNCFVTDIFMTPRWDQSLGARDEHETAKSLNLTFHYILSDTYSLPEGNFSITTVSKR